ncbi:MAG: hypothetical protein ACREWG_07810 [Gammaproteobacteria bacterium]
MEIGLVAALFWMYAEDWGDLTILYGFFLLPLVPLLIGASQVKRPPSKILIACALGGLLGLVGALGIGPHLAGSVAIHVVLIQSVIMGIVYWKRAEADRARSDER